MKYSALFFALTAISVEGFAPNPTFKPSLTKVAMADGPDFKEVAENAQTAVKKFFDKAAEEVPKFIQEFFDDESNAEVMEEDTETKMDMSNMQKEIPHGMEEEDGDDEDEGTYMM
mmetsp:Transcript_2164/g.3116  ORF Transcript_2164/g.3116 Transcript_2164/m.3116 type:complete len:115 (-) Transcript_2164:107-451(-)